jgi:phenylalanyl-tRNA synthetase beta chain
VKIVNPLSSDLNVLRQTLILSGLEVVSYNINRQRRTMKTFEYGSVYRRLPEGDGTTLSSYEEHQAFCLMTTGPGDKSWTGEPKKSSFFQLKGVLELLIRRYGGDIYQMELSSAPEDVFSEGQTYSLPGHGGVLAVMGTVNPALAKKFDIRQPVFAAEISWPALFELVRRDKVTFKEMPRFPEVRRDLALLLDEGVRYSDLRKSAFKSARKILREVSLFDVYRGDKIPEGKKQYALGFVLQDLDKTLQDADVENVMNRILSAFTNEFGAELR